MSFACIGMVALAVLFAIQKSRRKKAQAVPTEIVVKIEDGRK